MEYSDAELRMARTALAKGPHLLNERERDVLRAAGYGYQLTDLPGEDEEIIMPTLQHYALPVWLVHVGLQAPDLLGRYYAAFQALVMLDHQTDCLDARGHGKGGRWFAARVVDVAALAGISRRSAYYHTEKLAEIEALDRQPGKKSRAWPHWYIDRERMVDLYRYAAPALRPIFGGIRGQEIRRDDKRVIYGIDETRRKTLDFATAILVTEETGRVKNRDTIEAAEVREILGIPEGFAE